MDVPIASISWVGASCAQGASCAWWDSDAGPSCPFIIGGILVLAAVVVLYNLFGERS